MTAMCKFHVSLLDLATLQGANTSLGAPEPRRLVTAQATATKAVFDTRERSPAKKEAIRQRIPIEKNSRFIVALSMSRS